MSWFLDLGTECMIANGDHVRAIGWLSDEHPFSVGDTPAEFRSRLREFCQRWRECLAPLGWPICAGPHQCEICSESIASGNIGVPAGELLFVAPVMVAHTHRYRPPAEFVEAVLSAPLPGSPEYPEAVAVFRAISLRQLTEMHGAPEPGVASDSRKSSR